MTASSRFSVLAPYIIAEIGVNHEGDLSKALLMIEQVARAGGHCAKFQTYKADKIASREHAPAYWDLNSEPSTSQHALFKKYDAFGPEEYKTLAEHCKKHGIDFLSTPFDLEAVEMLEPLMKRYKVASADITNIPLLRKVAATGKPVILSTGASTLEEVAAAVRLLKDGGTSELCLMHTVLNYPTPKHHAQLALMQELERNFGGECMIGYSDHVVPEADGSMPSLEMACLQGARVIEKHFTFDKTLPGNDHYHAMDEAGLKAFVSKLEAYRRLAGNAPRNLEWETKAIHYARRRIIAARPLRAGEVLAADNLIALRADVGIEIARWDEVIGRKAATDIAAGKPLEQADIA